MSITELKLEIIKKLTAIEDELVLEDIYRLVTAESGLEAVYKLSDEEIGAIQAGLEDVNAGRVYTSEQAKQIVKEWLKK
jgi:predicted transcriptional regulator